MTLSCFCDAWCLPGDATLEQADPLGIPEEPPCPLPSCHCQDVHLGVHLPLQGSTGEFQRGPAVHKGLSDHLQFH